MTHNTTTTTIAATFAEFLAHPEISGEIENLYLSLGDSGIQFPADAEDLIYAVGSSGSADADLLYSVEELADKFLNAASEMRGFIAGYLEQRGAIKPAIEAVEAFAAAPTEANRLALVEVSEALDGYYIPMPRTLRGRLRPFVTKRIFRSRINFGSLNWIAKNYLKIDVPVQEAA